MRSSAHSLLKFLPTVQKFISRRDLRGERKLYHRITAEFTSTTFAAEITHPLATFATRKLLAALVGEPDGFAAGAFRQTESNCSTSGSTSTGLSVSTPFSKLRFFSDFTPIPAPVRFAEPKYALTPSTMMHLKWTRGQSILSGSCDRCAAHSLRSFGQPDRLRRQANLIAVQRVGYRSKSSRQLGPGSFA